MVSGRRIFIAVVIGILCGGIESAILVTAELFTDVSMIAALLLNRSMIGFLIGVSAIHIHYLPHGIFMGFVGSLPLAIPSGFSSLLEVIILLATGIVTGIIIETGTVKLFKAYPPSIYPPEINSTD